MLAPFLHPLFRRRLSQETALSKVISALTISASSSLCWFRFFLVVDVSSRAWLQVGSLTKPGSLIRETECCTGPPIWHLFCTGLPAQELMRVFARVFHDIHAAISQLLGHCSEPRLDIKRSAQKILSQNHNYSMHKRLWRIF